MREIVGKAGKQLGRDSVERRRGGGGQSVRRKGGGREDEGKEKGG